LPITCQSWKATFPAWKTPFPRWRAALQGLADRRCLDERCAET
jgi:hypothetical protein